jgi:DNA polymerase I-like protein with 3'-5' exonuclease and polymerase domains
LNTNDAFLYGAGDELLGGLLEPDASPEKKRKIGAKLRKTFLDSMPALKRLVEDVKAAVKKRGYLVGLDGRHLHVRSEHSALNTLLQSAGALIMKEATVILWRDLEDRGDLVLPQYPALAPYDVDVWQAAHVHDEYQTIAREHLAHVVGETAVNAIRKAGESFNFRCPLDGEYKIGSNWAETH